jgi:hypothetical protein
MLGTLILVVFVAMALAVEFMPGDPAVSRRRKCGIALGASAVVIGLMAAWYSSYQDEPDGVFRMLGGLRWQIGVAYGVAAAGAIVTVLYWRGVLPLNRDEPE